MAEKQDGRNYTDAENYAYFIQELNGDEKYDSVIEEAEKECKVGQPIPNKCKIQTIHLTFMTKVHAKDRERLHEQEHIYTMEDGYQKQKPKRNQRQRTKTVGNAEDNRDQEKTLNANDANYTDILEQTATYSTECTGVYNTLIKIHPKQKR